MAKRGPKPKNQRAGENQGQINGGIDPVKNNNPEIKSEQNPPENTEKSEKKEELLSMYEAAEYFRKKGIKGVSEETIKLWINHGHLVKVRGGLIPMSSIVNCRFNVRT